MSLAAAKAMDDLADSLFDEAGLNWPKDTRQMLSALGMAHRRAAAKIRERAEREIGGQALEVPEEYRAGQAGTKKGRD